MKSPLQYYLPTWSAAYLQLMRINQPIGIWLLYWPSAWSILLAPTDNTMHRYQMLAVFGIGAIIMRGAGCTYNDIIDKNLDGKVTRTALRPLPAGTVTTRAALGFLIIQLLVGLIILWTLNPPTIFLGVASLSLVFTYPFMKRITFWPQIWLGLTFNWGALMGWTAVTGSLSITALLIYIAGFFWTIGYDTIYAHQDKEDDSLVGIKSSALALGKHTTFFLALVYTLTIIMICLAIGLQNLYWLNLCFITMACCHCFWQIFSLNTEDPKNCLKRFQSNRELGILITLALIAS
ncbi:MAG: 4-hydroxybenzoate octaprenyltransferase [Rhodospirillaceae bacterium]|nr:4-hydroxybenzoate octaprenyltransferase [Rhodospirillaceae bacterium]